MSQSTANFVMPRTTTDRRTETPRNEVDSAVLRVLPSNEPIKAGQIIDSLQEEIPVPSYEVVRSIWRLADRGEVRVHAGKGVYRLKQAPSCRYGLHTH